MSKVPRCPSCGWTVALVPYVEVFGEDAILSGLDLWEGVCSNPNDPGRNPPCMHPVTSEPPTEYRVVSPAQAVYR